MVETDWKHSLRGGILPSRHRWRLHGGHLAEWRETGNIYQKIINERPARQDGEIFSTHLAQNQKVVPAEGIEPPTKGL